MNITEIENFLHKGLAIVKQVAPLASLGGPAAGAWGQVVANVAATADNLLTGIEADAAIIASGDTTKIRALQAELQAENAKLNEQVLNS